MEDALLHTRLEDFSAWSYTHDQPRKEVSEDGDDRWEDLAGIRNHMASTAGSFQPSRGTPKLPPLSASSSAPVMLAQQDNMMRSTGLSFGKASTRSQASTINSWRRKPPPWDGTKSRGLPSFTGTLRANPDDGSDFVDGCIPNWAAGQNMRSTGALQHELTWQYLNVKRHELHPLRLAVGEYMDMTKMATMMRISKSTMFQFWRDLRPPFTVLSVERVMSEPSGHPDGDLHHLTYVCPIDYASERLFNRDTSLSTFDNVVQGIAEVRIHPNWPTSPKTIKLISWGKPCLKMNFQKPVQMDIMSVTRQKPPRWNPVAAQLGRATKDASCSRLLKESYRKSMLHQEHLEVPEEQKVLIGPQVSLEKHCRVCKTVQTKKANDYEKLRGDQLEGISTDYLQVSDRFGEFLGKMEPKVAKYSERNKRVYHLNTASFGIIKFAG